MTQVRTAPDASSLSARRDCFIETNGRDLRHVLRYIADQLVCFDKDIDQPYIDLRICGRGWIHGKANDRRVFGTDLGSRNQSKVVH